MAQNPGIVRPGLGQARDVFSGNNQEMNRGLGAVIPKGHDKIVFIHNIGGNFARDDFLEDVCAHNTTSAQDWLARSVSQQLRK